MKILKIEIDYGYELVRVYYQNNDGRFGVEIISFIIWDESNVLDQGKIIELINNLP